VDCISAEADPLLVAAIAESLAEIADPTRAPKMQAYMKSEMPYLGVALPAVRVVTKAAVRAHPPDSVCHLGATAAALWRGAIYREHRYASVELTRQPIADGALELLVLYEEMIVTGAWWDHVDAVAPRLGQLLFAHPDSLRPVLLAWSRVPDRWLRRVSIIAQVGAKARTDVDLLAAVIDANAAEGDFFIRKSIGWALRDYARSDPEWVRGFVEARVGVLSSLSQREATKHLMGTDRLIR
jgi:3-methyladenine DNA glycosylase AlkD